jgi:DNA helicase HerA-like ATPase
MENKTLILQEFEQLKGQLVIYGYFKVGKLIALSNDEDDYYYVIFTGKNVIYDSCVEKIIPLKRKINDEDYIDIERVFDLNYSLLISELSVEMNYLTNIEI